jgi:hypothetical protein
MVSELGAVEQEVCEGVEVITRVGEAGVAAL